MTDSLIGLRAIMQMAIERATRPARSETELRYMTDSQVAFQTSEAEIADTNGHLPDLPLVSRRQCIGEFYAEWKSRNLPPLHRAPLSADQSKSVITRQRMRQRGPRGERKGEGGRRREGRPTEHRG